ncbi:HAD family hydrolase [Luteipulveratus mongoliensis]|uniref:Haloacid dehalogenase n=1 Tax=Luteipulveratus mongoliensis TaxID=571913 RepID=A0A0K1JMM0_9MICO|nr:HAD hydrolase-like protein [Luteipulveratus mongoliensis]AKU17964.1 hypothetical protein VV02_22360 [Luteipulveratus mongoliensis]
MTDTAELVVGFDLDMTLVDSRAGIVACMHHALGKHGGSATDEELWPLIGAPLYDNLALFLPEEKVEAAAQDYRAAYLIDAVDMTTAMPGSHDLLAAIHERGGRVVVVSAKVQTAITAVLDHVGLSPDEVVGDLFAEAKARGLQEHGATAYVGDHAGDMRAARTAQVPGIGVTTGPHDAATLREAGATYVVDGLADVLALV